MAGFHGLELHLASFSGAVASRVIHPPGQSIAEHSHDWACVTLSVIGDCTEEYAQGRTALSNPAAIFLAPGTSHANIIGAKGLETISILFDPRWLRCWGHDSTPSGVRHVAGLPVIRLTQALNAARNEPPGEEVFARIVARFLAASCESRAPREPSWLLKAIEDLDQATLTSKSLHSSYGVEPATLHRSYRRVRGEGIRDRLRRRRIEQAVKQLRETDERLADIAVDCGFYDQSHMNRCFGRLIGRTPLEVRSERHMLGRVA